MSKGQLATGLFCGDEEMMIDRMVAASRKKNTVALPSFGRNLVPYFVPGAEELCESFINVNTDVDAHRREGASVLDIPSPRTAHNSPVKESKSHSESVGSPVSVIVDNQTSSDSESENPSSGEKSWPERARKLSNRFTKHSGSRNKVNRCHLVAVNLEEKWAGPGFSASPSPDSLPLPTFLTKCTIASPPPPVPPRSVSSGFVVPLHTSLSSSNPSLPIRSPGDISADTATMNLKKMLNLS